MEGDKLQNGGCLVVGKGDGSEVPTTKAIVEPVVNEPLYKKYHNTFLQPTKK